ncbi:MAG: hypothetical protein ACKVW3_02125 [Phycisphaerales bacterium]
MNRRRLRLFYLLATLHFAFGVAVLVLSFMVSMDKLWPWAFVVSPALGFAAAVTGLGPWTRERTMMHAMLTLGGGMPWCYVSTMRALYGEWQPLGMSGLMLVAIGFAVQIGCVVAARWWRSPEEGECWNCGYDRRATPIDAVCPECGEEFRPIPDPDSAGQP